MSDLEPIHVVIDALNELGGRPAIKAVKPLTPSVNDVGAPGDSGANWPYKRAKELWEKVFQAVLLEASGTRATFVKPGTKGVQVEIPEVKRTGECDGPWGRVLVEGVMVFGDRIERDQGNFRSILEKWLGDALQLAGLLTKDDWTRYEFGNLERGWARKAPRLELTLFPASEPRELVDMSIAASGLF